MSVLPLVSERAIHPAERLLGESNLVIPPVFGKMPLDQDVWGCADNFGPLPGGKPVRENLCFRFGQVRVELSTPVVILLGVFKANVQRETYAQRLRSVGYEPDCSVIVLGSVATTQPQFPGRRVLRPVWLCGDVKPAAWSRPGFAYTHYKR